MLNRTNRTLSANSTRLNLGTRSLAQNASGVNNGNLTLRTALVYPFVDVRADVEDHPEFVGIEAHFIAMMMGQKPEKPVKSPMSGSSLGLRPLNESCQSQGQEQGQISIALAIPPAIPTAGQTAAGRAPRGTATRTATFRRFPRTNVLAWRPEISRRPSRAAHAVLASDAAS